MRISLTVLLLVVIAMWASVMPVHAETKNSVNLEGKTVCVEYVALDSDGKTNVLYVKNEYCIHEEYWNGITLIVDGWRFVGSGDMESLQYYQDMKSRFEELAPHSTFEIRPGEVIIEEAHSWIATKWSLREGYSLWYYQGK